MTAKTMDEVLHQEGAWCGNCEFEGWDSCKDCRDTCEGYARALSAAGFGLVADAKAEALRNAAEALEMQPSKLRAQYVETLRLYASEPWRLTTCPSECAANHPGREHGAAS